MKRAKLNGLLAKIEAVEGTDAAPVAATDGIQLEESIWSQVEIDYIERNLRDTASGNRLGRVGGAEPAGRFAKVTAVVALKGAGAAYAAAVRPELDVLLRMAGLSATVDATIGTETITYAPIDDNHESATVHAYAGGSLYKMVGCRARLTGFALVPAQFGRLTFEIMGLLPDLPTDAVLPAIDYPRKAVRPPVVRSQDLSLDAIGLLYKSLSFDQQLELVARPRGGSPDGHAGFAIVDYDPQLKAQIDAPDKAVFNPWTMEEQFSEFPWSVQAGTVQYNKATLSGGNGQIIKIGQAEDSKLAMVDLTVRALHGDATPGFELIFD